MIEWRMTLTPERDERKPMDTREYPAGGGYFPPIPGGVFWDITAAMTNEIIGGKCHIYVKLPDGQEERAEFYIRGKNPRDADVEAYFQSNAIDAEFQKIIKPIARHETLERGYIYNQFNARTSLVGLPNKTADEKDKNGVVTKEGKGWGMMQIDRGDHSKISTAEVWDWKANVRAGNQVLRDKKAEYNSYVNAYRKAFAPPNALQPLPQGVSWTEPPSNLTLDASVPFSTYEWSLLVLYNGKLGLQWRKKLPGYVNPDTDNDFRCPIWFDETKGKWTLHDNNQHKGARNPPYGQKIADMIKNPPRTVE